MEYDLRRILDVDDIVHGFLEKITNTTIILPLIDLLG